MTTNKKGFVLCPICGRPTKAKLYPYTEVKRFPVWCSWCKQEIEITRKEIKQEQ